MGTKKSFDISNGTEKRLFKKAENFNLDFLEIPNCKIYRFSEESTELQFDIFFGKIYYAKIQYLRTFREFCSNPCGSGIRKMTIAAE